MLDMLRWKPKKPPIGVDTAALDGAAIIWVHPTLIAEISFCGWSEDGSLINPTYKGLAPRQDNADVFKLEHLHQAGETIRRR